MSVLLYVLGIASVVCGVAAILFGIPVKEFSFGDTLIGAGATALAGGLVLIGLGAVVSQLQRIAELLGARPLARAGQPFDAGVRLGSGPGRVPFPPKPKAGPQDRPAEMPAVTRVQVRDRDKEREAELAVPPSLPNPDVPLMAEEEAAELPLSPAKDQHGAPDVATGEPEQSAFAPEWRSPPPERPSYFETMWSERTPPPQAEPASQEPDIRDEDEVAEESRQESRQKSREEAQPVAVLKSGVVDGMGYTLYVDGSIEAELPDGTLRFASINELRAHLEKDS